MNTIINFRNGIKKAFIIIVANIVNLLVFVAVNFKNVFTIIFIIKKIITVSAVRDIRKIITAFMKNIIIIITAAVDLETLLKLFLLLS